MNCFARIGGLVALAVVASPWVARAGQETRNGGNAIVCADSAELLDFYEGRELLGWTIPKAPDPATSEWDLALRTLDRLEAVDADYLRRARQALAFVREHFRVLEEGTELVTIPDAFPSIFPRGCQIGQLASFQLPLGVLVDGTLWKRLGPSDRAGLLVHEAVYKVERDLFQATNSVVSRRIVGRLFSTASVDAEFWNGLRASDARLEIEGSMDFGAVNEDTVREFRVRNVGTEPTAPLQAQLQEQGWDPQPRWRIVRADEIGSCPGMRLPPRKACSLYVMFLAGEVPYPRPAGFFPATVTVHDGGAVRAGAPLRGIAFYSWRIRDPQASSFAAVAAYEERDFLAISHAGCPWRGATRRIRVDDLPRGAQFRFVRDLWSTPCPAGMRSYRSALTDGLRECGRAAPVFTAAIEPSPSARESWTACFPVAAGPEVWSDAEGTAVDACDRERKYLVKYAVCE